MIQGGMTLLTIHKPDEHIRDCHIAIQYLRDGNQRYISNHSLNRNTNEQDRDILKDRQKPFAVVVTCSDSRVAPEIYFDQKLGDIIVVRNAGHIIDATVLGTIEYVVLHLCIPLVVVVGHSKCGVVTAAHGNVDFCEHPENLQSVLYKIHSATKGALNVETAIEANAHEAVAQIRKNETVHKSGAKVVGACYDIVTGRVNWFY
jgi:carbonic anhydrase